MVPESETFFAGLADPVCQSTQSNSAEQVSPLRSPSHLSPPVSSGMNTFPPTPNGDTTDVVDNKRGMKMKSSISETSSTTLDAPKSTLDDMKPSEAPPESASMIWTRRLILMAFWAVVVLLGVPHWNWTTSIPRSSLPLDSMNAWADGKVKSPLPSQMKRTDY